LGLKLEETERSYFCLEVQRNCWGGESPCTSRRLLSIEVETNVGMYREKRLPSIELEGGVGRGSSSGEEANDQEFR